MVMVPPNLCWFYTASGSRPRSWMLRTAKIEAGVVERPPAR
jgi:hypothetical protein